MVHCHLSDCFAVRAGTHFAPRSAIARRSHQRISEDRDDRRCDRDHRETDLVRRLEGRTIGGFAHAHMPDDVLDLHDGVVDQDAGRQRHGE